MSKPEEQGDGRPVQEPGLYVHKESGAKIEALTEIQGDAFVRLGFTPYEAEEEKPLSKQNRAELEATAEAEGVEITDELNSNKKLADAIREARGE